MKNSLEVKLYFILCNFRRYYLIDIGNGLVAVNITDTKWAIVSDIEVRQPAARPTRLATFICSSKAGKTTVRSYAVKAAKAKGLM